MLPYPQLAEDQVLIGLLVDPTFTDMVKDEQEHFEWDQSLAVFCIFR